MGGEKKCPLEGKPLQLCPHSGQTPGQKGLLASALSQFLLPTGAKGRWGLVVNKASASGWSMSSTFSQCDLGRSPWSTCWWPDYPLLPVIAGWSWEIV